MSMFSMSRRDLLKALGLTAVGVVAAACTPSATPTTAPAGEEPVETAAPAEEVAETITIQHWAQAAEPTAPDVELEPGEVRKVAYDEVAEAYMADHPNVKIEWYRFPAGSNIDEWLTARMTAQDAPEIYWANSESLWPHIQKNWALAFDSWAELPNPYVSGNERWFDQFEDVAVISQTGPDGKLYGINMDGAGVLTLYNTDAFETAGITDLPTTWTEFIGACDALLDAGFIPYGATLAEGMTFSHWLHAHIYNQLVWDTIYDWDKDGNMVITAKDLVLSFEEGLFPDWDAFLQFAHLFKELTPYFPLGYEGELDLPQLWRQGNLAMYMEGNWGVSQLKNDPPPHGFNWLAFPVITKDIWPAAPEKVVRIQGAWGAMQYHVPGYLAQIDPARVDVIMDWLMWSSVPEHVGSICKETGLVPLTKGAEGLPELAPFYEPYDRAVPYQSWNTMSASAWNAECDLWQQYLPSDMTDDAFLELAEETFSAEVDKVLEANPDWVTE